MAVELILAAEAEQDLDAAYEWYESQRPGLGEDFLSCVDACIQSILRNPALHPVVLEAYRRALIRRFPYAIFYEPETDRVTVYGVIHTSRDPKIWRDRLP